MKSRITFVGILSVMVAFAASAQNVEQDDMYFRSKDRAALAASKPLTINNNVASRASEANSPINPTDSYSARNVNPEYISQSKINPSSTQAETVTYFIPNYTPTAVNQNIYNNTGNWNYYGGGYRPSYYGMNSMMGGYGMGMYPMMNYGMMSGFGNSYYSPMGYYDPFGYNAYSYNGYYNYGGFGYSPGLSLSMGFGYGGFNNFWGGNSFYNNYWGGGYNPYYGYGNSVIIVTGDANGHNVAYGKRSSRSSDLNNVVNSGGRSASNAGVSSQTGSRSSNGRIADNNNTTASGSYYQRGWRSNPETNTRATWNNSSNSSNNVNSWNNNSSRSSSNSSFFNNSNTRSSSNWSGGNSNVSSGAGRSSGGSVSGGSSSSGGASRGRH